MIETVLSAVFWFFTAFLFAGIEIEIEGKHGWAEKLPTWYRTTGFCGRTFGLFNSGRPLTGYHSFMLLITLVLFHVQFVHGTAWTLAGEAKSLALYFAWVPQWDVLWFVLNPSYGWSKFRKDSVWWFGKGPWILGWPMDYYVAWGISIGLAYGASHLNASNEVLMHHMQKLALFVALTGIAVLLSPLYRRWYSYMRRVDDRDKAGIFHKDQNT